MAPDPNASATAAAPAAAMAVALPVVRTRGSPTVSILDRSIDPSSRATPEPFGCGLSGATGLLYGAAAMM
jgi:hypothetical protein